MSSPTYSGLISAEEALEREKSAFVLDKMILRAICEEGPLTLEDIRVKTLPLEGALGVKIDIPTLKAIIDRYIKQGLIWENK